MNNYENASFCKPFSHIYIEEDAKDHKITRKITARFPGAAQIPILHYKDLFNRKKQDFRLQKQCPKLILAVKHGRLVYAGAPVCQNFGNRYFYYTSSVMNCLYDCSYCYLQGMYPSANLVIFVNLEDIFSEVEQLLTRHPVYLSVSYDTDLLALESLTGYLKQWITFTAAHPDLTIEVRTKASNIAALQKLPSCDRVIFAWTLSPEPVIQQYETHTPSLSARLQAATAAKTAGFPLRFCFDPLIYFPDWDRQAPAFLEHVFHVVPPWQVQDVSVGVFRISDSYLKSMRQNRPDSVITQYPYENDHGVCHYGQQRSTEMTRLYQNLLTRYLQPEQIFIWNQ